MPSVIFSFPVKTASHNIAIVNCLNTLLPRPNTTITKETNHAFLGLPILISFLRTWVSNSSIRATVHPKETIYSESSLRTERPKESELWGWTLQGENMQGDWKMCWWLAKHCPYTVQGRTDEVMVQKKILQMTPRLSAERP